MNAAENRPNIMIIAQSGRVCVATDSLALSGLADFPLSYSGLGSVSANLRQDSFVVRGEGIPVAIGRA